MRSAFPFIASLGLLLGSFGASAPRAQAQPLPGDVNEDGALDVADVIQVIKLVESETTTVEIRRTLDFNRSGVADELDANYLAQVISGIAGFLPDFSFSGEFLQSNAIVTNQDHVEFDIFFDGLTGAFNLILFGEVIFSGVESGQTTVVLNDLDEGAPAGEEPFSLRSRASLTWAYPAERSSIFRAGSRSAHPRPSGPEAEAVGARSGLLQVRSAEAGRSMPLGVTLAVQVVWELREEEDKRESFASKRSISIESSRSCREGLLRAFRA